MLHIIDSFLNNITMYRVVLYYLISLVVIASVLSTFGALPYNSLALLISAIFITAVCWVSNRAFAYIYRVPVNIESAFITALILALIITPPSILVDRQYFTLAFGASVFAMASKYILAIRKKHIFNPAAIGVVLTALIFNQSASWWIGMPIMTPFVLLGGLLVVRKVQRFDLVVSFLTVSIFVVGGLRFILASPILFFAFVMLTEPLTTPPTRVLRIIYGALVGFLLSPAIHVGAFFLTPELALCAGNIFSYLVSPKEKNILKLKEKIQIAHDIYTFIFKNHQRLVFQPGQYLEWTLKTQRSDSRGNRRYFTIASSPTEQGVMIGVKFHKNSSTFKQSLLAMSPGDTIIVSNRAGDFVLPKDPHKKLVFIAGGIGITPFRSMIKYLLDVGEKRSIVLLYSNKTSADLVYRELFDEAERRLGIKV